LVRLRDGMAIDSHLRLTKRQRRELAKLGAQTSAVHALVQRARMILRLASWQGPATVARALGVSDRCVRKWRARWLLARDIRGLEDADRPGRPGPHFRWRSNASWWRWPWRFPTRTSTIDGSLRREFEYVRHGTCTLLAALEVGSGPRLRTCRQAPDRRCAGDIPRGGRQAISRSAGLHRLGQSQLHDEGKDHRWTRFNRRHGHAFISSTRRFTPRGSTRSRSGFRFSIGVPSSTQASTASLC